MLHVGVWLTAVETQKAYMNEVEEISAWLSVAFCTQKNTHQRQSSRRGGILHASDRREGLFFSCRAVLFRVIRSRI